MDFKKIKTECNKMIKDFVNKLGLDGEYYVSLCNTPIYLTNTVDYCKFYTPDSDEIKRLFTKINKDNIIFDKNESIENKDEYLSDKGLILINSNYDEKDPNIYISYMHEMFHSLRTILLDTQKKHKLDAITHYDKYVLMDRNNEDYSADFSQDILKGSIDTSEHGKKVLMSMVIRKLEKKYNVKFKDLKGDKKKEFIKKINKEFDNRAFKDDTYDSQMELQKNVDEALIEIMAATAFKSYRDNQSIMETIGDYNKANLDDDLICITNIILRHDNLELFKWMISPLEYTLNDVNYDFFKNYINENDKIDVETIKNKDKDIDENEQRRLIFDVLMGPIK